VPKLKEPDVILPTFTAAQIKSLVKWKPKRKAQRRLHVLILLLLVTGARISEALKLRVRDVDLDNMLITLDGKGRKQRLVPFSFELRKALFATSQSLGGNRTHFCWQVATRLNWVGVSCYVKLLCNKLGFTPPARTLHAFRHSFGVSYIRRGGSVFHLQKVLGHSTLEMTRRYANLTTEDLQAVHERVSLLRCAT